MEAEYFPIWIDKEGIWYYQGAEMFRKDILALFFQALNGDDSGHYYLEMQGKQYYIQVEDCPFVVMAVDARSPGSPEQEIELLLTDDSRELLDGKTLSLGDGNILYCSVKGGRFEARFSRPAWYQLANHVKHNDETGDFTLAINGEVYFLKADATNGGS